MFLLYEVLLYLVFLALLPWFLATGFLRGKYVGSFAERMGRFRHSSGSHDLWIHAVSVGETLAAAPLVAKLKTSVPDLKIVFTTTTATGREIAQRIFPEATHAYFPFDFSRSVSSFLDHHRPRVFATMETEIWPNVTRLATARGVRMMLVNARISDRSLPRYRRFRWLLRPILDLYTLFLARDAEDARRLIAIGAPKERIEIVGNLKFDFEPASSTLPIEQSIVDLARGRRIVILGSTVEGEDELLIPMLPDLIAAADCFVIIAPRKVERFGVVASLLSSSQLAHLRRTNLGKGAGKVDIVLLDSIGELAALYRHASVAFVGGSLVPSGGHNPIEPAAVGTPVAFGPYMSNFREIAATFTSENAARQLASPEELKEFLIQMLNDDEMRQGYRSRAAVTVARNRGAAARTAARIVELLQ
ncbi:MAG TPA: 3-deoxy-D-manno-octulosonic acid transferase [Thermoanaerobaculia bacterium]|nr:3-deoxy-D-manno-octulosonic acid transferase [Thermoanaerobaculia bacterium]